MNPTDPVRPDDARADQPVSIAEIADFLRQLRGLSTSTSTPHRSQPERDPAAERATFLARKADLFTRIAAAHPGLIQRPRPTATRHELPCVKPPRIDLG